jgi:hypothetical protein
MTFYSRSVPCPECGARIGQVCKGRTQSHRDRHIKAKALYDKQQAKRRLSRETTKEVEEFFGMMLTLRRDVKKDAKEGHNKLGEGHKLGLEAAIEGVQRLLRTRGAR